MESFSCTTDNFLPLLDIGIMLANIGASAVVAKDPEKYGYEDTTAPIASAVLWTAILGTSATVGMNKVIKCKAARAELAERHRLAQSGGAPPAPPTAHIDSVRISPATSTVPVGGVVALTAIAYAGGRVVGGITFKWSSSEESVAWVTRTGVVEAQAPGRVVIAANANNVVGIATVVVAP